MRGTSSPPCHSFMWLPLRSEHPIWPMTAFSPKSPTSSPDWSLWTQFSFPSLPSPCPSPPLPFSGTWEPFHSTRHFRMLINDGDTSMPLCQVICGLLSWFCPCWVLETIETFNSLGSNQKRDNKCPLLLGPFIYLETSMGISSFKI